MDLVSATSNVRLHRAAQFPAKSACRKLCQELQTDDGLTGSYSGPEVLVLYRKRDGARCLHEHGVLARFRYNDLKEAARAADAGPMQIQ